jgi:acyl-CoA thioesterase
VTAYTDLIAAMTPTDTGFTAQVPDDWRQGRTTYGGLSAALCLEAALSAVPDAPPLRSGQFAFVGPAAGELSIRTEVLRRGKSTLFMGVDLVGEQGLATRAILTFGAARQSRLAHLDLPAPATVAPDAARLLPAKAEAPTSPSSSSSRPPAARRSAARARRTFWSGSATRTRPPAPWPPWSPWPTPCRPPRSRSFPSAARSRP